MKNDKIERSVKRAFVNAAPYQLDKVTEKCKEQKGKVIPLENKQAKKSINKTFARIAAAAAALVLMIMCIRRKVRRCVHRCAGREPQH